MSAGFLAEMAATSAARLAAARAQVSEGALQARALATPPPPPLALAASGFDLIAEVKLRSPAAGPLGGRMEDLTRRVDEYARGGAAAVSVLTEPLRFDGALEHLASASAALEPMRVPTIRKDFLIDPYQLLEARVAGAAGVLLIVRMLSGAQLDALVASARELELFALIEAFDETDIERASDLIERGARAHGRLLVGLNCRDLDTLQVVPGRLEALAARLPASVPRVAESGVASALDAARVAAAGYEVALVGGALMSAADPATLTREMLAAGRRARGAAPA
ncbi:MAG TPA: indole-3-glycerol-phosphate synthase [Steroidobacteraceae bacterium]|nr:indole-3-glycerol-phosphate synthase [Steroidobacteraceae bacterium]